MLLPGLGVSEDLRGNQDGPRRPRQVAPPGYDESLVDSLRLTIAREIDGPDARPPWPRPDGPFHDCRGCGSREHPGGLCPEDDEAGWGCYRAAWPVLNDLLTPTACPCGGPVYGVCQWCDGYVTIATTRYWWPMVRGAILLGGWAS